MTVMASGFVVDGHKRKKKKEKRRWNSYEVATRLDTESPKYRTSVLLACIGDEAFDVFDGFSFEKEDQNDIDWDCAGQIRAVLRRRGQWDIWNISLQQKKPRGGRDNRCLCIHFAEAYQDVQF